MAAFAEGVSGTILWRELSITPTRTIPAISLGASLTTPYNNIAIVDITWMQSGIPGDVYYVSCLGGFEDGLTQLNGFVDATQVQEAGRLSRVTSPVRRGSFACRVECRPGDIAANGERAEFHSIQDGEGNVLNEEVVSGTQYLAWSTYFPADWVDATGTPQYQILWQLKSPDRLNHSPALTFLANLATRGGFYFEVESGSMDDQGSGDYYWGRLTPTNQSYELGHWVDWVAKITFAKTYTGEFTVWRRDEGETDFTQVGSLANIPTLQYHKSEGIGFEALHYWKAGIYRYKDAIPQTDVIAIYYFDGFTRGNNFDAVVAAAF